MSWTSLSQHPALLPGNVHLWLVNVQDQVPHCNLFFDLLSSDETERASRFRFEKDRNTFVIAKGVLRLLLSRYFNSDPTAIAFQYSEHNKPSVPGNMEFNVSHSGDKILLGFGWHAPLGVDVEFNKKTIELERVARVSFSDNEVDFLLALPEAQRQAAFFRCWTRKEAFIKAKGGGLSIPLDQFEVNYAENQPAELKIIRWDQPDVRNWDLTGFDCGPDHTGAAIVNQSTAKFHYFAWQNSPSV